MKRFLGNPIHGKLGLPGLANLIKPKGEKCTIETNLIAPAAGFTEDNFTPGAFEKLNPGFMAPGVPCLRYGGCTGSGLIVKASAGHCSRSATVTVPGTILSD